MIILCYLCLFHHIQVQKYPLNHDSHQQLSELNIFNQQQEHIWYKIHKMEKPKEEK